MKPFYLTTPIYYVNALPHLGHAYTTIIADSLTRFELLMGRDAIFTTGTDEHGDKIVQAAEKTGLSANELTDRISEEFQTLWPKLETRPTHFVRTTSDAHKKVVRDFLQKVYDAGDIYFGEYGGHYCYGCERFYTEKELENGLCPQHLVKPEFISEKNYFFRMSKYQDWLKNYILDNPDFIRPERYRTEVISLLNSGALDDLCISRPKSRLTWGIELPFDANYVCYVWFDALLAYTTALGGPGTPDFDKYWPEAEHLVAKDILKPHAIFWPTMLKAAGLPIYKHLNVHGYWLVRDTKMSKSLGNVIAPLDMAVKYGIDSFRYFLLREMHFGSDGSFSEEALVTRINSDLANDLGNLFSRVLSMAAKFCGSAVPACAEPADMDLAIRDVARTALENYQTLFAQVRFSAALEALWELVRALNKYVDSAAPWALAKQGDTARLGCVMYTLLECMRKIALNLWPVMPEKTALMLEQLGTPLNLAAISESANISQESTSFGLLPAGTPLAASSNLFPRIDLEERTSREEQKAQASKAAPKDAKTTAESKEAADGTALIEFGDFQKLDLRVGTVVSCEKHPKADKLLKVMVNLGEEAPRQILAGIAEYCNPEDLPGKQVTVVANLAPRTLRGLESQGMILAIHTPDGLVLLSPGETVPPGSKVS
ncbi:methionine--tRNA ligase [Desulfovibrio sp. OttesenSCG-928-G15]|nr:methionine--tRNA ligase [Desulfovibrio sp. OttesenSCG-928-G15]